MRVTPPILITDAKLTSSGAAEPHAPSAYAGGTTYAIGDIVKVVADFAIYESLVSSNTGHAPATSPLYWRQIGPLEDTAYSAASTYALGDVVYSATYHRCYESLQAGNIGKPLPVPPETETAWWLDVGPTNKWAMFDLSRNTQTVNASPLVVVLTPGERINTIGLTGLKGSSLTLKATSVGGGGTVYPLQYDASASYDEGDCVTEAFGLCYQSLVGSNSGNLPSTHPADWAVVGGAVFDLTTREVIDGYTYFFEPFSTRISNVVFDVPAYSDIIVTITLTDTSGNVKIGSCILGTNVYLGAVLTHARSDGINFSSITRDLYGNATLVPRRTVPKTNQTLTLDSSRVNRVMAARTALNATPCLWTGLDDSTSDWFETLVILGVYKQFEIEIVTNDKALVTLELEEI